MPGIQTLLHETSTLTSHLTVKWVMFTPRQHVMGQFCRAIGPTVEQQNVFCSRGLRPQAISLANLALARTGPIVESPLLCPYTRTHRNSPQTELHGNIR